MRIADRIFARGSKEERAKFFEEPPPVLHAGNIALGFYLNTQPVFGPDDYRFARPPWPTCYVEWPEPKEIQTKEGRFAVEHPARIAVKVVSLEGPRMRATLAKLSGVLNIPPDTAVLLSAEPSSFAQGRLFSAPVTLFSFLREDGYVLDHALIGDPKFMAMVEAQNMNPISMFAAHHVIPMLCFSFANCKNVATVDVTEKHAQPEKIRRRLRLPVIRSYTLRITNKAATAAGGDSDDESGGLLPHHLVRGHFATYTADKPLFGNPKNIGRFWIPPHARGKKENGQVLKHYSIDSPREAS